MWEALLHLLQLPLTFQHCMIYRALPQNCFCAFKSIGGYHPFINEPSTQVGQGFYILCPNIGVKDKKAPMILNG